MSEHLPDVDQLKLWRLRIDRYGGMQLTKSESLAMFDLIDKLNADLAFIRRHPGFCGEVPQEIKPVGAADIDRARLQNLKNHVLLNFTTDVRDEIQWAIEQLSKPQPTDAVETAARARFIEVHGIPARDPWDHAPSATKEQYREWARKNTPPPEVVVHPADPRGMENSQTHPSTWNKP